MRQLWLCTLMIFALSGTHPLPAQTESPITVALLPLDVNGLDADYTEAVTEYLRDQLRLEPRLEVVHPEVMLEKFAEIPGLGGPFIDAEVIREAGKRLGARFVIGGTLGKVGDFFTISLMLIDSSSAAITTIAEDHTGTRDSFQYETMEIVGKRIIEKILSEMEPSSPPVSEGEIELKPAHRWYKKWWIWASAAGGAALIGGVAMLSGSNGNDQPNPPAGKGPLPTPPDLP